MSPARLRIERPSPLHSRPMLLRQTAPHLALALALLTSCKGPPEPSPQATGPEPVRGVVPEFGHQTLSAAGIEIAVPSEWTLLDEHDPDFVLAFDSTRKQPSACWIERRRQGLGPLALGVRAITEGPQRRGYMRGVIRGVVQETPAADGSTTLVHCRARRSDTKLWSTVILPILASQRPAEARPAPAPTPTIEDPVVQLCSAGPIVPGYVCALRSQGGVYCGPTDGALERVVMDPAIEIGCRGQMACARTSEGAVSCWSAGDPAEPQPAFGKARSITDACVVDEQGAVQCLLAHAREGGGHDLSVVPLRAFDDPSLAITDARVLMSGSTIEQGCVITDAGVVCWDELGDLPVRFHNPPIASDEATGHRKQAPESIDASTELAQLRRSGDRLCTRAAEGPWRCTEREGLTHELIGCERQACGCSLLGGNQMSCEDQPEPRIDALPQGRIAEVIGVAEPCAVRRDGGVVCRSSGSTEMRSLGLREPDPPPGPDQK